MNIFVKISLSAIVALSILGCGGATPQPKQSSSMPSWYLNELPSTPTYYFGVGEGTSKETAQAKALSNIAASISSTVSASMEMSASQNSDTGYSEESKSNVKSSTEKIKFTGVRVVNTEFISGKFYTNVSVDRDVLFNAQKKNLDNDYKKALTLWNQMKMQGTFAVLNNSKKLESLVDTILLKPTLVILKSINPDSNSTKYREDILSIKNNLIDAKSKIIVYVKSDSKLASYYKDIVEKYISADEITIVNSKNSVENKNKLLTIEVSTNAKKKTVKSSDPRLRGASFAAVTVVLTTKNSKNKIVAQNRVNITNISKDGLEEAKIKTKKFEREIQKKGILNILLKKKK